MLHAMLDVFTFTEDCPVSDPSPGGQTRRAVHVPAGGGGLHLPPAAECAQQEVAPRLQPPAQGARRHQGPGAAQGRSPAQRKILQPQEVRLQILRWGAQTSGVRLPGRLRSNPHLHIQ